MHISFAAPQYVSRDDVPADVLAAERQIYLNSDEVQSKPEQAREKIVDGMLAKRFFAAAPGRRAPRPVVGARRVEDRRRGARRGRRHRDGVRPGLGRGVVTARPEELAERLRRVEPGTRFGRVLLKLSGESLMGDREYGVDPKTVAPSRAR